MTKQSRTVRELQLASLRRALSHANDTLRLTHALSRMPGHEARGAARLDAAQSAVVGLEEEVGLLENDLDPDYSGSGRRVAATAEKMGGGAGGGAP